MNHAERVKELAQEFAVAAVVAAIVGRLGDSKPARIRADKKAAELLTAIDAMQSALDDAVAKLAALDAEVERLRKDAERYRWLRDKAAYVGVNPHARTCLWVLRGIYEIRGKGFTESVDAALSEEVKGG